MSVTDAERARLAAIAYRKRGMIPLPMRVDEKRPDLYEYADLRQDGMPDEFFQPGAWYTPNIQIATGVTKGATHLAVVDLDGMQAQRVWRRWLAEQGLEYPLKTWHAISPSEGVHVYFVLPPGTTSCESRAIWGLWDTSLRGGKGGWCKHKFIEILGDGKLVVAPPSFHPKHPGERYCFAEGLSPHDVPLMQAPTWLLAMQAIKPPGAESGRPKNPLRRKFIAGSIQESEEAQVRAALSEDQILKIAQDWGLRPTGRVNRAGWMPCFAVGRDDDRPSGRFKPSIGVYQDMADRKPYSLFAFGVLSGAHGSIASAIRECAEIAGVSTKNLTVRHDRPAHKV